MVLDDDIVVDVVVGDDPPWLLPPPRLWLGYKSYSCCDEDVVKEEVDVDVVVVVVSSPSIERDAVLRRCMEPGDTEHDTRVPPGWSRDRRAVAVAAA